MMNSGHVFYIDPIQQQSPDELPQAVMEIINRLGPVFDDLSGGWVVVNSYETMYAPEPAGPVVIMLGHVQAIIPELVYVTPRSSN